MPLTYAASIRVLDLDPPVPDGTPSDRAAWASMLDAKMYARYGLAGALAWEGTMAVSGSAGAPFVQVGPISSVCLYSTDALGWFAYTSGVVNLGVGHIEGLPGTLSANTWYYVYVYATIGLTPTLAYQISTYPPHPTGVIGYKERYKQGETKNYLHLGSFRAVSGGTPRPLVKRAGVCTYGLGYDPGVTPITAITNAAYVATTALPDFIPPHANTVDVIVTASPNGVDGGGVEVQPAFNGSATEAYSLEVGGTGSTTVPTQATWRIPLLLLGDAVDVTRQNLQARGYGGGIGGVPTCGINVTGWPE